jgi:hypothetical protein
MSDKTAISWTDVRPARFGPKPSPARDGDKVQARQRVNVEVRSGRRASPNAFPCVDCGHVWPDGERRHEYDHHLGYAAEHHGDVEPVCTKCHAQRDSERAKQTACKRGHALSGDNVYLAPNGTRHCRACGREKDRARPPRGSAYWAQVNDRRRGKANG